MFHCSVIKVPVVLTALIFYHIVFNLSRTFFIFLKLFSELFSLTSVSCDSQSRLSHLSRSVKDFFEVFLTSLKRMCSSVFSTACLLYHIFSFLSTTFFIFFFDIQTSKRLTELHYTTILSLCQQKRRFFTFFLQYLLIYPQITYVLLVDTRTHAISFTFVPVGPVKISPSTCFRLEYASFLSSTL